MHDRHLQHLSFRRTGAVFGAAAALMAWSSHCSAEADPRWSARLGYAHAAFDTRSTITVAGASIDLPVNAGGTLRAPASPLAGTLGEVQVAPVVVSVLYTPRHFARLEPYVGTGVAYAWMREAEGVDVQSLQATSEWGVVVQAGCEATLGRRWSAFVDVRKLYVDTSVSGVIAPLGGLPVAASVDLDPLILNAGIGYRF